MEPLILTSNTTLGKVDSQIRELDLSKKPRVAERLIQVFLFFCGAVSILTTLGIILELGRESIGFFSSPDVSIINFLTGLTWQPVIGEYGVLPLVSATLMTTLIAMLVSLPLGLGAAIFLSEYASRQARSILKPTLEILAGVPTVVYGYFALTFMTPLLRGMLGNQNVEIFNTLSAGLVMGIMILPLVSSMSEDALNAVPRSLREAAYGLGGTRFETSLQIVVPAALSGIIAAFIIGISRAVGETMIVRIAAGSGPLLTFNPLRAAETMTGYIARVSGGDAPYGSPVYSSIFAIALLLFLITLLLNMVSRKLAARYREVYE